jgi:translation initiation factor 2 subunit 1
MGLAVYIDETGLGPASGLSPAGLETGSGDRTAFFFFTFLIISMAAAPLDDARLQCRMYEQKFPEVDDLVMVSVRQIADMGAYVNLLEYNNIEGMILLSELSRRRIRSLQKLIRVGRNEVVVVLRVDKEKGYIDLSKRRVSPEEVQRCEERYLKSKAVHSIMRHVAERSGTVLEDLYKQFGWPLYQKYGHAFDAFKMAIVESDTILGGLTMDDHVRHELLTSIKKRLTPQAMKIRADIELTCYAYEGVEAIKQALTEGLACKTDKANIKIELVASPLYIISTQCMDKQHGIETLEKAVVKIEETIKRFKGSLVIKMKPRAVSETEDQELAAMMERAERENAEVSGDDSDEDGSEEESEDEE